MEELKKEIDENKRKSDREDPEFYSFEDGGRGSKEEEAVGRIDSVVGESFGEEEREERRETISRDDEPQVTEGFWKSLKGAVSFLFGKKKGNIESLSVAHYICYYDSIGTDIGKIAELLKVDLEEVVRFIDSIKGTDKYHSLVGEFILYSERVGDLEEEL